MAFLFAPRVGATPYATALTNSAGVISFRLNESADGVKVISSSGAVTNDLGPLPQGLTVTNLGISGVYKVQVSKAGSAGWQSGVTNQISVDTNNFVKFVNQRGVAVNKNTNSPYFGRIYVSVATAGTTTSNEFNLGPRTVGEGFYLLNADQTDALGDGDTARTGGLVFDSDGTTGTESPYRLFVGPDDNLFISDWSNTNGTLFVTDPNVATNSFATNVLAGSGGVFPLTTNSGLIHGSIASCWVEGSVGVDLTIYAQDEDLQTDKDTATQTERNSVWLYSIGSGSLPHINEPTKYFGYGIGFATQTAKIDRGPDGKWYASNRRADTDITGSSSAGIFVRSSDGTTALWDSRSAWRTFTGNPTAFDFHFSEMRTLAVSPDGRYLVGFKADTNTVKILPLESGIPNITNLITMPTLPTTSIGRDICFDAVGNLYTVSSGQEMLRVYSPGGNSVVTTGSDGTLTILQLPEVTVQATTSVATEAGPVNGVFTLTRGGGTADPLTVGYNIIGTATNGVDYTTISESVTFLPGQNTTNVTIVPVDDSVAEFTETATLSLNSSNTYNVGAPSIGTLAIVDNETPELSITNISSQMFERTNDYARYQITRSGDTNAALFTVNLSFTGSATSGVDYYADTVMINPGEVTKTFQIYALDDSLVETNETVICSLAAGAGYTIGSPSSATVTIVNATLPPEAVLFSDNFDTDTTASWTQRFGSTNGIEDFTFTFNYDYSFDSIPSAPHSTNGTTRGLKMTVNKIEASLRGAAGINFYPNGQNFSGDFALRFDMYLIDAGGASATEGALFGINHSGNKTNWFRLSGGGPPPGLTFDGLFFDVLADNQSSVNSYALWSPPLNGNNPTKLTFTSYTDLTGIFKAPPWAVAGLPSNLIPTTNSIWADVEASQSNNVVALKVNGTQIFTYTNTSGTTSGNIMIGYVDPFDSIGLGSSAVVFDNVRVVRVFTYRITSVVKSGGSILIDFTSPDTAAATSSFKLQSSATVDGTYADISAAITQTSLGTYHVVASAPDNATYYRIRHF